MINTQKNFKNMTFGEWLVYWFELYKKNRLKPYSIRNIEQMIRLHTPNWLKAVLLRELSFVEIDAALSAMPPSRTLTYVRQVWNSSLKKAQQLGLISTNPVAITDKIKYKKRRSNALTISEQKKFVDDLEGQRVKWLMLFYLHTGVRRTEALTLQECDIDKESKLIRIRGTKTEDSYRCIILTPEVEKILAEQQKQNKQYKIKDLRIFPFSKEWTSREFKRLCPNHHLHDLRHTFITRCAECGVNINVCQQLVGHSTADMTLNVYTHVVDDFKRKEFAKFSITPNF